VRLDHLLSRVSERDPTTDRCSILPFAVKGAGLNDQLASYHFSVVKVGPWACSSAG
jgi:hypothetical protein